MGVQFYNEFIPENQRNYFDRKRGVNNNGILCKSLLEKHNRKKFVQPSSSLVDRVTVATVVVFYNEEGYALEKTLKCLSLQLSNQRLHHDLLLVGDGLEQMSTSMGAYLQKLFYPQTIPMDEDDWPLNGNTCVVNANSDHNFWPHGNLSLVLKRYNRGKWNSHEWHMKSFARHSDYCFLTDVGCQYNPNIIEKFLGFIEDNPECVGVTGRRVAQTYHQQADPSSVNHEDNFSQGMLRALQSHLFEAENNTRMENFIGCVPILHGHCTFLNWSKICRTSFVDLYFRLAYKSPSEIGVLMSQLRLAEDSVLGTYLLTHSKGFKTAIVEDAFLYFDVELTWENFVKQRRRWYNSNIACAKYLLFGSTNQPHTIVGSSMPIFRKVALAAMTLRWLIALISMKLLIGVFGFIFYHCALAIGLTFLDESHSRNVSQVLLMGFFTIYIFFVASHVKKSGQGDCSFNSVGWFLAGLLSSIYILSVILLIALNFAIDLSEDAKELATFAMWFNLLIIVSPWVRTSYKDPARVVHVLLNIPNLVNIVIMGLTVNGFLHAYCLARFMDLSWGNRPSKDISISPGSNNGSSSKNSDLKCSAEKCLEHTYGQENLCREHEWLQKKISLWKLVNVAVVLLNIGIAISAIKFEVNFFWPLLLLLVSLDITSYATVILADIIDFAKSRICYSTEDKHSNDSKDCESLLLNDHEQ